MKRLYWIFRAAWHMSKIIDAKDWLDYRLCWRTADVVHYNEVEQNGTAGDWEEAITEELSNWID